MKEQNSREKLEESLNKILPVLAMDKNVLKSMREYYISKNMSSSIPMRLVNGAGFGTLKDVQLCIFVKALNSVENEYNIDENKYFTEEELNLANAYKEDKIDKNENVVVFENVDQSRDNIWISTKITFQQLTELSNRGIAGYDFETQRNARIVYKGKDMIKLPFVNQKAVNEMKKSWMLGTFIPNTITFNIERKSITTNRPIYNPGNRTLTVTLNEGEVLNIVDGYHRTLAALDIMENDPDFNIGFYYLRILYFSKEEAHDFILQESKGTPISVQQMKFMNEQDINMILTKEICNFSPRTNLLHDKATVNNKEITHGDKCCFYNTISDAISHYFDITKEDENGNNDRIKTMLIKGLNIIIKIYSNKFKDINKTRSQSVETSNNIFALYIALLSKLYSLDYDKETVDNIGKFNSKIKETLSQIDFSIDNPLWKELKIVTNTGRVDLRELNLKDYNKIKNYINDIIQVEVEV